MTFWFTDLNQREYVERGILNRMDSHSTGDIQWDKRTMLSNSLNHIQYGLLNGKLLFPMLSVSLGHSSGRIVRWSDRLGVMT